MSVNFNRFLEIEVVRDVLLGVNLLALLHRPIRCSPGDTSLYLLHLCPAPFRKSDSGKLDNAKWANLNRLTLI